MTLEPTTLGTNQNCSRSGNNTLYHLGIKCIPHVTKGDESYELTLPLNKQGSNVGTLYSHPSYNKYDLFCQAADIKINDNKDPIAVPAYLISDDEDKEENGITPQIGPLPLSIPKRNHLSKAIPLLPSPEDNDFRL